MKINTKTRREERRTRNEERGKSKNLLDRIYKISRIESGSVPPYLFNLVNPVKEFLLFPRSSFFVLRSSLRVFVVIFAMVFAHEF
jgi:hypothetical protein